MVTDEWRSHRATFALPPRWFAFLDARSAVHGVMFATLGRVCAIPPGRRGSRAAEIALLPAEFASLAGKGACPATPFANRATLFAMPTTIHGLVHLARHALGVGSQGDFGVLMGSSRRTGQRWETGRATPSFDQLCAMTAMVYPKDPELAAQLAQAVGHSLVSLGIVKPAPAAPSAVTPAAPLPLVEDVVDSIVCAAADAMNVLPRDVRPALLAAFARARRLGLAVETVEGALAARSGVAG